MGNCKCLKFDLDAMYTCETELSTAIDELQQIQTELQKAMDDMISAKGWDSDGSSALKEKYDTTWTQGINERIGVLERMKEHIATARMLYQPVMEEAEKLKLETE